MPDIATPSGRPAPSRPEPVSPTEPPPTRWLLPAPDPRDSDDLVAVGADLEPGTLLAAYRRGLFPMPIAEDSGAPIGWWSPYRRGVLPPEGLHVSRTLRRSCRRYRVTLDRAFPEVVAACADPSRPGSWITPEIAGAYGELHRLGWAHSVEVWEGRGSSRELVGGLYGVAIGGLFAGESMFHRRTDASKVALVALVSVLRSAGDGRLIDVQWRTDHLASLGVIEIPRARYLARLAEALRLPNVDWLADVDWVGILETPSTTTSGSPDPA